MTYTVSGANFNQQDNAVKGTSINYKENKTTESKTGTVENAFAGVVMSAGGKPVDNTYESLLKEADDVKNQIMNSASGAKLGLKALMMKLSGADAVKIDEDGFNLTDATDDDMVNIVEKIKIELAMHSDDYVSYGTSVSRDKIESVAGNAGAANRIEQKMSGADIAVNDDSIREVSNAVDMAQNLKPLSEDTKAYMVANNIVSTIAGIYQAQSATVSGYGMGAATDEAISDEDFEKLRQGIEKIINDAGLEVNEGNINNARMFIDKQIPVTTDNLSYKAKLDSLDIEETVNDTDAVLDKIFEYMKLGKRAEDTDITGSDMDDIITAFNTLENATYEDVANVLSKGNVFTIASLKLELDARVFNPDYSNVQEMTVDKEAVDKKAGDKENIDEAYDTFIETRVLMSTGAAAYLVNNNISVLTTPMEELNDIIKDYEKSSYAYGMSYEEVLDIRKMFDQTMRNPARVFSMMYEKAADTYEAVGTQVRADLGDSLKKAVDRSVDDIIDELGLEGTKNDRRAINVLAANGMEITPDNIEKIKTVNAVIDNLVKNMKPETVFNMIKDGINPMKADIYDVNEYLTNMNQNATKDNEEKFSKFLYKLDRTDGITKEQRKQFIGIYQMMNIFTKDAGVAAGALVKQGTEVTMSNLISAYNSRKHYDMDVTIDDNTGLAQVRGTANYYMALFSTNGALITPNTLKNVDNNTGIGSQSVENFLDQIEEYYDAREEARYYEEYIDVQVAAAEADANILREIRKSDMDVNTGNIQAVKEFMESGQFPYIKGKKTLKDYAENSIEKIGHKEKLSLMYDEMKDEVEGELQEAVSRSGDLDTQIDINYEEFLDLRLKDRTIGYIKNLAAKHDYRIPYATDNGDVGMIRLTLVQDSDNAGRISVNMSNSLLGNVSLEAKTDANSMKILVVTDKELTSEASDLIDEMGRQLSTQFEIDNIDIYTGKSDDVRYITYDDVSENIATDKLYQMAGVIVKALAD